MIRDAIVTVERHHMLVKGDRVLAAVSGGADSVALLCFLREYCAARAIPLGALHLNHLLRGAESERDERFVRALCERWKIPLAVRREAVSEVAARDKLSLEEAGRICRYRFFEEEGAAQCAKVATAHTLDDSAETLLLNLARGASLRGLGGIPPVRGRFVRPLLGCTREQVEAYLAERGQDWVEDSSNRGDDYARNRVRHHVLPLLAAENPRFVRAAGEMSHELRADAELIEWHAGRALVRIQTETGWSRRGFLELAEPLRRHAAALLLRERSLALSRERIAQLLGVIERGAGAAQLSADWRLRCNRRQFFFERVDKIGQDPACFELKLDGLALSDRVSLPIFGGKRLDIRCRPLRKSEFTLKFAAKEFKNAVDCDRMDKILYFRRRLPGDRLRPPGSQHSRTLKNLFQEAGIPPALRAQCAVLAGEDGAVKWVEGLGPDQSAAVGPDTKRVLHISALEDEDAV